MVGFSGSLQLDMTPCRHRQARDLIEQQDESNMPTQGLVPEEVSAGESGAWQPGQVAAGGQPPVPPPVAPEQQADLEVEQPAVQQASGTGSTRAGQRRTAVTEDRTALLERFLRLRPPMFFGEYDPDKAESWTHEMECTFKTMECTEEDQRHQSRFAEQSIQQGAEQGKQEAVCYTCGLPGHFRRDCSMGQAQQPQQPVSTRSSYRSTSSLPSSRHPVSSSRGSTNSSLSSSSRTSSSSSFHSTSSRSSSSNPSRRRNMGVDVVIASLCFASEEFYESLVHHTPERQCDVMVDLPSGYYMHSFGYLEGITVELEAHSVVVDCQQKTVRFEIPGAPVLCFRGETSQQWQGACRAKETGRPSGSPDLWAVTAKIGSSAWVEATAVCIVTPEGTIVSRCVGPMRWHRGPVVGCNLVAVHFPVTIGLLSRCLCLSQWAGLPLGPSSGEHGRLPRCVQLLKVTPSWPCPGGGARRLAPLEGPCVPRACWACCGLQASGSAWFLLCLPRLFARCFALEGLSRSEVVSIAWDPHPQEPIEGVFWAMSVLELAANLADSGAEGKTRPVSPSSHCLALHWFWSHVGRSGMGPQLGQAAVVHAFLWCSVAALSRSSEEVEAGAKLANRGSGWCVLLLATSGGGLVVVVVTSHSLVQVCGSTGVCGFPTSWHVQGLGWFCLWALDLVEV
ncbi:hypothetical protein Taro_030774 [Colocasia esculenta]|uniref:CCHC-type domain-containing protein n=1 Tax=Colocasia esculenta TaxID=4460 RepID=A0A843VYW4_COLES|nr:hypothetical protein [Colocasia esculenta]